MTGRAVLVVAAFALAAPATAAAHPDWRAPAPVGAAQEGVLRFPQTLAYDPSGPYVYVADQHSFWVQKFTADGRFVSRFGGYGSAPGHFGNTSASASPTTGTVGGIGGLAVDGHGRVYVLDSFNSRIERFSADGVFESEFGTFGSAPGELNPGINGGLALLGDELYVGDQDNDRVQRFHLGADGRPDAPPVVFGSGGTGEGQLDVVSGLAVDPGRDHDVFVADDRNNRVQRFGAGGAFEAIIGVGRLLNPYDTAVDLAGRLFVADNQHHRIVRFDDGQFVRIYGGSGPQPGRLNNVRGVAVAPDADAAHGLFATNTSMNQVSEFGVDGAFIRSWGGDGRGPGAFMQPRDVAVEPNGDIVVADTRADRVQVLRASGAVDWWARISTLGTPALGAGPREFEDPTGVAVDPRNGDVWVVEGGNHRVQRIPQSGLVAQVTIHGGPNAGTAPGQFKEPLGIAVASDGTVWVADTRNDRLQRLDRTTNTWSVIPGFTHPTAVAVLSDGRLAVTELGADPLTDPEGAAGKGRLTVLAQDGTRQTADGLDRPEGVASDGQGGVLVSETQRNRVLGFDSRLKPTGEVGGPFTLPMGTDLDPSGRLLVADTYANRVLRYDAPADSEPAGAGGTVAPTLALTLAGGANFGSFTPGVEREYTASTTADVISTAGDAALSVSDPGHLTNGPYSLSEPLRVAFSKASWAAPVSHDPVAITFKQHIGGNEPLRTGAYGRTLTFTLATTTP